MHPPIKIFGLGQICTEWSLWKCKREICKQEAIQQLLGSFLGQTQFTRICSLEVAWTLEDIYCIQESFFFFFLAFLYDVIRLHQLWLVLQKRKRRILFGQKNANLFGENEQMPFSKKKNLAFCPLSQINQGNALLLKLDFLKIKLNPIVAFLRSLQ